MKRYLLTYNVLALLPTEVYDSRLFKIKSKTLMQVWHGKQKKWMFQAAPDDSSTVRLNEVTYKNIMLSKLHPDYEFSVCAIPTDSDIKEESLLDDYEKFSLDLAGGARKHGHFLFTRKQGAKGTVGQFYFPPEKESMGRINYGSISMSEIKALFVLKQAKILVVRDPDLEYNRPKPGSENPWKIGDAHGKINADLLTTLLDGITNKPKTPTQFRLGIAGNETRKGIWGKGTVLPLPASEMQGYDLVLPESCFKTYKPPFGENIFEEVCLGALGEAQERKSKGGTQIWSWFPIDIIEQDVMPATRAKCEELIQTLASKNVYKIVSTFQPQQEGDAIKNTTEISDLPPIANKWFDDLAQLWESGNPQDDTDDDSEPYMSTLAMILAEDQGRILEKHPYVIDSILRSLKKKWTRLAINGAFRAASFMAMPDDSLPDLAFSCKHLKQGTHVSFRYPVRHWGDIQLWENVGDGNGFNGVFFVSHVTFGGTGELNESPYGQGGDFDGDYGNAARAEKLPNITQRIRDWNDASSPHYRRQPKLVKAPKSPIQDTLKKVALRSMDNLTGLVASQIMWAQAKGLTEEIIPDGSGRTVLEVLSQALQDEVDRFKNDLQRDTRALEMVSEILTRGAKRPEWLTDYKSPLAYKTRTMNVGAPTVDGDTISHIVRTVNGYWVDSKQFMPLPESISSQKYRYLFGTNLLELGLTEEQIKFVRSATKAYYDRVRDAANASDKDENSGIKRIIREVKEQRSEFEAALISKYGEEEGARKLRMWAAAYWFVAHNERGSVSGHPMGKAGLPFLMFPDIIAERLKTAQYEFTFFGLSYQPAPNIASSVPITIAIKAKLLGTRQFMERSDSIYDLDSKKRIILVNNNKQLFLYLKLIGDKFVDNDFKVYATLFNNQVQNLKGEIIGAFGDQLYLYLQPDGNLIIQATPPVPKTITRKLPNHPTILVKLKFSNSSDWINGGITEITNESAIEVGQLLSDCEIISATNKAGGWSSSTIKVRVLSQSRKTFVIIPYDAERTFAAYESHKGAVLSIEPYIIPNGSERFMVYMRENSKDANPKRIGLLALDCQAIPKDRWLDADVWTTPEFKEILFSPI